MGSAWWWDAEMTGLGPVSSNGSQEAPKAGAPHSFMAQGQGLVKRCFPGMLIHLKPIFAFDS